MTIHQCPKCELRFDFRTEVEDHCWHDHPEFRHEYPAVAPVAPPVPETPHPAAAPPEHHGIGESLGGWLTPRAKRPAAARRDPA